MSTWPHFLLGRQLCLKAPFHLAMLSGAVTLVCRAAALGGQHCLLGESDGFHRVGLLQLGGPWMEASWQLVLRVERVGIGCVCCLSSVLQG